MTQVIDLSGGIPGQKPGNTGFGVELGISERGTISSIDEQMTAVESDAFALT